MHPRPPSRAREFWGGVQATGPLVVGAIPFAIIYGAVASTSGLSPLGAVAMSALVFAGSAQFIAANLLAAGTSVALILLTTLVVNLRHLLYAATLAPHLKHLPQRWLLPLGFWLTDESFVVVVSRYRQPDAAPYKHWYHLGSALFMYTNWIGCTVLGVLAGQHIQDPQSWGLDFAMIVTFIGMLVPFIRSRPVLVAVLAAGISATLTYSWPNKLGLIAAALLGVGAGVIAETYQARHRAAPDAPAEAP
ncbi:MAG TPA: AzlC family ABC transporter permease [Chloroflexia bacterium]|nr:AzlC family ABC transporter permease [Chloroflexia bacterium]